MERKNADATKRYFVGPLRWRQLPPNLEARARALYYSCGLYLMPTFEQWEVGFCREETPEEEIRIWEAIDAAFRDYSARRELSHDLAEEVVYSLLCISLGIEKDDPLQNELKGLYAAKAK
jgi:hypothetical protein